MNKSKAQEILCGLSADQTKRLFQYQVNLRTDKDPQHFDDKLREHLLKISKDEGKMVNRVVSHCDSLGWNQSKYRYSLIQEQVSRFADTTVRNFSNNPNFIAAKQKLMAEAKGWRLRTLRYGWSHDVLGSLPRTDTHAGFSYILTGKRTKGEYRGRLHQDFINEVDKARKNGSFNKPILIGSRTQSKPPISDKDGSFLQLTKEEVDSKKKTRLVSMVDIYVILAENIFAKPFQQQLCLTEWYAGGKNDASISSLIKQNLRFRSNWISLDYSSYDQSISDWMIREAFDIIRAAFEHDIYWDEELFKIVREDFIHKVFITGDGLVESKKGVPSGSMFTQIVDSLVNRLMIDTYFNSIGLTDYSLLIMGDDNLITYNGEVNPEFISTYLKRNFDCTMNPSKVDQGTQAEDVLFLSRYWTKNGPWRSPEALIAKMVYPERFRNYQSEALTTDMIVLSYFETFNASMMEIFKRNEFEWEAVRRVGSDVSKWLSGYHAYRIRYLDKFNR